MKVRRFPLWTALGVVLVVALIVGSGVLSSPPPTAAQRASAIESALRCPSCEDLSVAESSASTAVTVRATVTQLIAEGRTDQQIESYLVDRYGSSIVLDPPAQRVVAAGLAAPPPRRPGRVGRSGRRVHPPAHGDRRRSHRSPADRRLTPPVVEERRRFLVQSLADADAEYLAGDLSDKDYLALRHRDMVRLAALGMTTTEVEAGEGGLPRAGVIVADDPLPPTGPSETAAPRRRPATTGPTRPSGRARRNRWFLGGAVAAFAAALITAVFLFATARQPGQSVTGSFAETPQQQTAESLAQAAVDENQGRLDQAAQLYQSVLTEHPDNEVAMAQLGWLEFETGRAGNNPSLVDDGTAKLNRAVRLDPDDYAVRLYLGTVLWQEDGDAAGAVVQYRDFLADGPPATIVKQAAPEVREAYRRAGDPIPSAVGG